MAFLQEVNNVGKNFGPIEALKDVNLKVVRGRVMALLGPSGSGKTTLLRILGGLDCPSRGEIRYKGKLITDNNRLLLRQNATMVFQKSAFFDTTVFQNIAYGLKLRRFSKEEIKDRVKESLELVRLNGYEKRQAKKLSGGEQQRVALARALVLDTELLLLDEPTVNIDPKNASIIEDVILRANREIKTSIVLATHNLFQAEAVSENVTLLLDGAVKQVGASEEIFGASNKYLTSFARFENCFSGISFIDKGISKVQLDDGVVIETAIKRDGRVMIFVRPEDIILSKMKLVSSARNVFEGEVTGISDLGDKVKLRINAGKDFVVQITKRSFKEMQINIGSNVFLTFKASSVGII